MANGRSTLLKRAVVLLTALLILKVTVAVVWGYRDYLPPNFSSDFLRGRERTFYGSYQWAFYTHLASGPFSLLAGLVLLNQRLRRRFPAGHRILGRAQVLNILLLLTPSGLWMAGYAQSGPMAGVSFALLSLLTGGSAALGWRAAVRRRFADHQRWMERCFLLLCSAVAIRVVGGFGTVLEVESEWFNVVNAWSCWLVPLTIYEALSRRKQILLFRQKKPVTSSLS